MICKYCNQDLKDIYFEKFIDKKRRLHKRAMCCFCRSKYWQLYNKKKKAAKEDETTNNK